MSIVKAVSTFLFLALFYTTSSGQTYFPWPVTPFNSSQLITGVFCEYRSTSTNGHYHNGTDIPKPDGSPVYPSKSGRITSMVTTGSNAYVRVNDIAYVHIQPNPSLSVGDDVVASATVLGTILNGMGHVHFTDGYSGANRNSLGPGRGLAPYNDPWPPVIKYVRFYQNNSTTQLSPNRLTGRVDIIVKVEEANGAPGSSTSVLNNGTYKLGYKIFNSDTSEIIFEPPNNGLRFKFDSKPNNSCVNITYFRPLSSTSSHVYQVTNTYCSDSSWDTRFLPEDDYVVMIFTEDTKANTDTAYVRVSVEESDIVPPAQPVFSYLQGTEEDMRLHWYTNPDEDLLGYRLYFSFDAENWNLFQDEDELTPSVTDTILPQVLNRDVYFRLSAIDNAPIPNESDFSDVYGLSNGPDFREKVLIVDGFDRTSGSWPLLSHNFVHYYSSAILANNFSFDTAPNEAVEDSLVNLTEFPAVFWFLGDESSSYETFSKNEQVLIRDYLENGGMLFVSGSEIATDLDQDAYGSADQDDELFLKDYLKIDFSEHESELDSAFGLSESIMDGLSVGFGNQPYPLAGTDVITPASENVIPLFEYEQEQYLGIQYEGTFGNGSSSGKLVLLTFPFETVSGIGQREQMFAAVLNYFFGPASIKENQNSAPDLPAEFSLHHAYPNPFNPQTSINYDLPSQSTVELAVYNILGKKISTLFAGSQPAGLQSTSWNGRNEAGLSVPSGIYFIQLRAISVIDNSSFQASRKIILSK